MLTVRCEMTLTNKWIYLRGPPHIISQSKGHGKGIASLIVLFVVAIQVICTENKLKYRSSCDLLDKKQVFSVITWLILFYRLFKMGKFFLLDKPGLSVDVTQQNEVMWHKARVVFRRRFSFISV